MTFHVIGAQGEFTGIQLRCAQQHFNLNWHFYSFLYFHLPGSQTNLLKSYFFFTMTDEADPKQNSDQYVNLISADQIWIRTDQLRLIR